MGYSYENNKIHKTANKEWILTSVNLKWYINAFLQKFASLFYRKSTTENNVRRARIYS